MKKAMKIFFNLSIVFSLLLSINFNVGAYMTNGVNGNMIDKEIETPINVMDSGEQKLDDIILERGYILTYEDFVEIRIEMEEKNKNKPITDKEAKLLIVKKIKEKEKISDTVISPFYTIWGMNLNAAEIALTILYPVSAIYVYADAQTALEEAENRYQYNTLYQGNGDAFRHAYWNALMTNDIGSNKAELFANAHESETPDGIDKTMDLYNNAQGRSIGQTWNPSDYISITMTYVNWGFLYRIVDNLLVETDSSGKL